MAKSSPKLVIKFPSRCRPLEPTLRSRGVPPVAFQFRKLDLQQYLQPALFEAPGNKVLKTTLQQQHRAFEAITNKLFKPRLIIVGTSPGGVGYPEATRFILWLALQAYQRRREVHEREPLWYSVYNNRDDRLTRYYPDEFTRETTGIETPSFLVLDNIYPNSSQYTLNKVQDIINRYRYQTPVYVLVNGITGLEFSYKIHIQANYYFHFAGSVQVVKI